MGQLGISLYLMEKFCIAYQMSESGSGGSKMGGRFAKSHATDINQPPIIAALEQIGCRVYEMERPVDLLVEFRSVWVVLEVKNTDGRNKLTKEQIKFFKLTRAPAYIVRNPLEAIESVQRAWRLTLNVTASDD